MYRPFAVFAFWLFLAGYLPETALRDFRGPYAVVCICALLTAFEELLLTYIKGRRSAGQGGKVP